MPTATAIASVDNDATTYIDDAGQIAEAVADIVRTAERLERYAQRALAMLEAQAGEPFENVEIDAAVGDLQRMREHAEQARARAARLPIRIFAVARAIPRIADIPVATDAAMPTDTIELRDAAGRALERVTITQPNHD